VTYLKSDALDALVAVSGAASVDPCRLNLINVQMTMEGSQCTFVATDGHRLHLVQTATVSFGEHGPGARKYMIGDETISILKSLTGGERNVTFDYQDEDGGMITYFGWGSGFIICRMGSVTYPEYREILEIGHEGQIVADRASLLDAVEGFCRAARAENKGSGRVKVELNGSIKISGVFGTTAICRDIPYRAKAGPDVTIGLNCDYLREALGLLTSETVTLNFTDPLTPFVIRDNKSERIALVMPMRL
jgi:DNA polymerase-3 subunit beta